MQFNTAISIDQSFELENTSEGRCIDLKKGDIWTIHKSRKSILILKSGDLWITVQGDKTDHVLKSGSRQVFENHGLMVIQALGAGCMRIIENV